MPPCPTVLGSTTSTPKGGPSLPVSPRTRSPRPSGATRTPPRRGTSPSPRGSRPRRSVPDLDPAVRLQEQRTGVGALEGVVEGVHVAQHAVAAELRRRVRIHREPPDSLRFTGFGAP